MVKETLSIGEKPIKTQIEEINAAAARPVKYSKDATKLTTEELSEFKKINCTLCLSKR